MHLDGEAFLGIEELDQQRKPLRVGQIFAENFAPPIRPELVQGFAAPCPGVDHALRILAIDQLPGFTDARALRQAFLVKLLELAPAPDALHEQRLKLQWLGKHVLLF